MIKASIFTTRLASFALFSILFNYLAMVLVSSVLELVWTVLFHRNYWMYCWFERFLAFLHLGAWTVRSFSWLVLGFNLKHSTARHNSESPCNCFQTHLLLLMLVKLLSSKHRARKYFVPHLQWESIHNIAIPQRDYKDKRISIFTCFNLKTVVCFKWCEI